MEYFCRQLYQTHPDHDLIELCKVFIANEQKRRCLSIGSEKIINENLRNRIDTYMNQVNNQLYREIYPLKATTLQGMCIRAKAIVTWMPDIIAELRNSSISEGLTARLIEDLLDYNEEQPV